MEFIIAFIIGLTVFVALLMVLHFRGSSEKEEKMPCHNSDQGHRCQCAARLEKIADADLQGNPHLPPKRCISKPDESSD